MPFLESLHEQAHSNSDQSNRAKKECSDEEFNKEAI